MLLRLLRNRAADAKETCGYLFLNGEPFCKTIEPPRSGNKLQPKGCIPKGWYNVVVTRSPRFKRDLPLLCMVPGFEGIRIHAGLSVENTRGCICVGERHTENYLTNILKETLSNNEEIHIHIADFGDYIDTDSGQLRLFKKVEQREFGVVD